MCDGARGGIVWAFILWHEVWRHDTIRYGEIYDISVSNESNHITFGKPRHAQLGSFFVQALRSPPTQRIRSRRPDTGRRGYRHIF